MNVGSVNLAALMSPVARLASSGMSSVAPIVSVAGRAVSAAADTLSGFGFGTEGGMSAQQGVAGSVDQAAQSAQLDNLIQRQLTTSLELQKFSTESNIEKSKHESRMAVIANIRSR